MERHTLKSLITCSFRNIIKMWWIAGKYYLALINRAGGLYGKILTEVCTHDRGQDSSTQTGLARLIRFLLYGKNKDNLIRLM